MLGHYDPRKKTVDLKLERVNYWLSKGAQPSATVGKLVKRLARQARAAEPAEPVATAAPAPVTEPPTSAASEGAQP
jgi:small subunit ribosomal protein S16